ncbi:unnamed protein product [Litomosoides sigmodontis]|uniref:Peptidase M14 domain-containing protein n=1 Tax=Litomosoides sigmodontis TaxID=42156 RepID=A0A3P6V562_LITSI|nr:unnamed protein product [Litomosoides sigmodontis]
MIPTRDKLFDKEKRLRDDSIRNSNAFLGDYHSYGEIVRWLNDLERRHRNIVKVVSIGNSTEGKIIYGVKLSAKTNKSKSAFWIDGGIHAREWVAVQTALYLIKQLITDYYSNPKVAEYLELLDVYIFPCLNPDGYEYSRSNPNEPSIRLWRKNRASPEKFEWKNGQKRYCPGVDLNRNFGFHFGESGSSPSPCSSVYHGSHAFSEPETRAVRDAILRLRQRIKAYMSLHTYSQLWIYPYSYAQNVYPPDFDDLKAVAHNAVNSIVKLYGTKYEYGTGPEVIYAYSGGSSDWVKQATSAKYSYVIELRPSKSAPNGFVVDKRELLPVGRETYEGVKVVFDKVIAEIKQKNSVNCE